MTDTSSPSLSSTARQAEAGPSTNINVSPPECMKHDEITQADQARLPPLKPRRFAFLHRKHLQRGLDQSKHRVSKPPSPDILEDEVRLSDDTDVSEAPPVRLESGALSLEGLEEDYDKDVYRWAVLYENQRG